MRIKNIESNVVGQADLLLMPDLNAGKMRYGNSNCVDGGDLPDARCTGADRADLAHRFAAVARCFGNAGAVGFGS